MSYFGGYFEGSYALHHGMYHTPNTSLILVTAPASEPVSLAEAKAQAYIDLSNDDDLISGFISAARSQVEDLECWIQLITATFELRMDCFPFDRCHPIVIPRPPLRTIESIKYIDTDGVDQTWGTFAGSPLMPVEYEVDAKSIHTPFQGEIRPTYGNRWPCARRQHNSVRIRFTCGFGAASEVPWAIKSWIKIMVATMYANREKEVVAVRESVLKLGFVDSLLDIYRVRSVK